MRVWGGRAPTPAGDGNVNGREDVFVAVPGAWSSRSVAAARGFSAPSAGAWALAAATGAVPGTRPKRPTPPQVTPTTSTTIAKVFSFRSNMAFTTPSVRA